MNQNQKHGIAAFVVLATVLLAHHLLAHGGHFGFDDMHYARLAQLFADGRFQTTQDHYSWRWGMVWPFGLLYSLFGVNDHSSAAAPFALTLFSMVCVYTLTQTQRTSARIWAMAFTALSEWVFFYSNKLMPDVPVMACVAGAFTAYYAARFGEGAKRAAWMGLGAALWMVAGFLFKETVLLVVPLWLYLFVADLLKKRNRVFWTGMAIGSALAALVFFGWSYLHFGSPLARMDAIAANSYFNPCSYDQLPFENTLKRIGYELWAVFLNTGLLAGLIFLLPAFMGRPIREVLRVQTAQDFLLLTGAGMLLLSNFMSTSYKVYVPLCLDIRHYLFAVPFVAAAAAVGLDDVLKGAIVPKGLFALGCAIVATGVSWFHCPEALPMYVCWALVLGSIYIFRQKNALVPAILVFAPLLFKPCEVVQKAWASNYPAQKALVYKYAKQTTVPHLRIVSNTAECNIDAYLMGFDSSAVQFVPFKALNADPWEQADSVVLIMNGLTAWMSNMDWEDYPEWVRTPDSSRVLIEKRDGVEWYGLSPK